MWRGLVAIVLCCWAGFAMAETRVALVIGNSTYENAPTLPNPGRDATAIARKLERLGFDVTLGVDLGYGDFSKALGRFSRKASAADISLVYYAGHGIELSGQNFMIPTDAVLEHEAEAEFETVSLQKIQDSASRARQLSIVLVDACRDNPFVAGIKRLNASRSLSRGLAPLGDPGKGELISFATEAGRTAADGDGDHSPYAESFLELLDEPGVEVGHFFRRLRGAVNRKTDGLQTPIVRSSLPEEFFYLVPPQETTDTAPAPVVNAEGQTENEFFESGFRSKLQEITPCDLAAGYEWHPRVKGGFSPNDAIEPDSAFAICQAALLEHPGEWFFYFLAGRSLWLADENDPRIRRYMELGGRADPAFAYDRLGLMARLGIGGFAKDVARAAEYYTKAVDAGYAGALNSLAELYTEADPPDYEKTVAYFEEAIAAGVENAANELARMHLNGRLPEASDAEALRYYQIGCEGGDMTACGNIGWMHIKERVPDPDKDFGRARLTEACVANEGWACRTMGHQHLERTFEGARDAGALQLFERSCKLGDANGCGNEGWLHGENRVAEPDMELAGQRLGFACKADEAWACNYLGFLQTGGKINGAGHAGAYVSFEKGCALGNSTACSNVGWMHKERRVPEPDMQLAIEHLQSVCKKDSAFACSHVGEMFELGIHGTMDFALAQEHYAKGCDLGNGWGCSRLAAMYEAGNLGPVDFKKAMVYFDRGCEGGNAWGCSRQGALFEAGEGTEVDFNRAAGLYEKGCNSGNAWGCGRLGRLYDQGNGVAKDATRGFELMLQSCEGDTKFYCEYAAETIEADRVNQPMSRGLELRAKACALEAGDSCAVLGSGIIYAASEVGGNPGDLLLKSLRLGSRWAIDNARRMNRSTLRAFQTALKAAGHYAGSIDGVMGPGTRRAMEAAHAG